MHIFAVELQNFLNDESKIRFHQIKVMKSEYHDEIDLHKRRVGS